MKDKRILAVVVLIFIGIMCYYVYSEFSLEDFENNVRWENLRDKLVVENVLKITISGIGVAPDSQRIQKIIEEIRDSNFSKSRIGRVVLHDEYSMTIYMKGGDVTNFDYQGNGKYGTSVEGHLIIIQSSRLEQLLKETIKSLSSTDGK